MHCSGQSGAVLLCVYKLHVAYWLPANWTLIQLLGTPLARHVVPAGAEHGGDELVHAHVAQLLVLDLHQESKHLPALCLGQGLCGVL